MGEPAEQLQLCHLSTEEVIDKILLFIEQLAGFSLYAYQLLFARRVIESVLGHEGAVVTGLWSRQSGKTECIAMVTCGLAVILPCLAVAFPDDPRFKPFVRGFLVGIYAPIEKQARLPFARIRSTLNSERGVAVLSDPEIGLEITANRGDAIGLSNGSLVISRTASPDAQIEGETHHLVVCEESQRLSRSKVEKEIIPMLASTNGTMVKIGTAWESRGGFHHSIQYNIESQRKTGKRSHFEFNWKVVAAEKKRAFDRDGNPFHLNYAKFVKKEITRLGGEDSEEFKMNFLCLWQESRVIAVDFKKLARAALTGIEAGPRMTRFQVAGLDVGKVNDSTVLTLLDVDMEHPIIDNIALFGSDEEKRTYYRKTILDWMELEGAFEGNEGQYHEIVRYLSQTNCQLLLVDATAMGNPVFERLQVLLGEAMVVEPFMYSLVTKSHLYKHYLTELHAGRVFYAAGEETQASQEYQRFVAQHQDLDKVTKGQYVVCEAPEGGHDDYPDSAALAVWAQRLAEQVKMGFMEVSSGSIRGGQVSADRKHEGRAGRYARRW